MRSAFWVAAFCVEILAKKADLPEVKIIYEGFDFDIHQLLYPDPTKLGNSNSE